MDILEQLRRYRPWNPQEDENSRVGWFPLNDAAAASNEPWMRERVYRKLNEKLTAFL